MPEPYVVILLNSHPACLLWWRGCQVENYQQEVDRLGAMLKQIETYNEQMKSEIAVTRRAAYAAEEAVQRMEKDKVGQDFRCGLNLMGYRI